MGRCIPGVIAMAISGAASMEGFVVLLSGVIVMPAFLLCLNCASQAYGECSHSVWYLRDTLRR